MMDTAKRAVSFLLVAGGFSAAISLVVCTLILMIARC